MSTAYLGLGSNVNAGYHIRTALQALTGTFGDIGISPIYRSKAVGFEGGDFINLVVRVQTGSSPNELRNFLRRLEDRYGRDRTAPKWSDRTLDIDILLFDQLVLKDDQLILPRPEILKFAHVLKPLADLAPDLELPVTGLSFSELWSQGDWGDVSLELLDQAFIEGN